MSQTAGYKNHFSFQFSHKHGRETSLERQWKQSGVRVFRHKQKIKQGPHAGRGIIFSYLNLCGNILFLTKAIPQSEQVKTIG